MATPALRQAVLGLSPCAAELAFEYRPRFLHCTHGSELRMRGDDLAGEFVCPVPSTGPAWGDTWGLLMAPVVGRSCTDKPLFRVGRAPPLEDRP